MVMDAGRLVEFASPQDLLSMEQSFFKSLVDQSADKEQLYEMAGA
jgi:ABC-type multidrug transport system fused ATPase/permease subunit